MKPLALHLAVLAALAALGLLLPAYHATNLARVMVLAVYAIGYNLAFGYTGLLCLGHALFFAAGLYAAGLGAPSSPGCRRPRPPRRPRRRRRRGRARRPPRAPHHRRRLHDRDADVRPGRLPDRPLLRRRHPRRRGLRPRPPRPAASARSTSPTTRPATPSPWRSSPPPSSPASRSSARRTGRVLVAIRENPERSRMLGYDPFRHRLLALAALRPARRRSPAPPMRCSSATSAPPSPRSSTRSCRCSGCCSAAPAPSSARSSAPR